MISSVSSKRGRSSRGWSILGLSCALFFTLFILFVTFAESSHFMSGTFSFARDQSNNNLILTTIQSWRWNYPYSSGSLSGVNSIYLANGTPRQVTAGTISRGVANNSGNASTNIGAISLSLTLKSRNVDPLYSNDFWFFGESNISFGTTTAPYWAQFYECCRISVLQDSNNDRVALHNTWFPGGNLQRGLVSRVFPRVFINVETQLGNYFEIAAVNPDNNLGALTYVITSYLASNALGDSQLVTTRPDGRLDQPLNDARPNWIPRLALEPSSYTTFRAYAYAAGVKDPVFTGAWHRTDIDFLFIIEKRCNTASTACNSPPVFDRSQQRFEVVATLPFRYTFTAEDNNPNQEVTIETTPVSSEVQFIWRHAGQTLKNQSGCAISANGSGQCARSTLQMDIDVAIDGPGAFLFCLSATDNGSPTKSSLGTFCPQIIVIRPNYIFLSGVVRTFNSPAQSDAARITGSTTGLTVSSTLDPLTRKPTVATSATGANPVTSTQFNRWWSDDSSQVDTTNLYTITMINGHSSLNQAADQWTTGNPKRVYTILRPKWNPDVPFGSFFTYQLSTQFDVLDSENGANALKFSVTGGEMWVYMNNKLVLSINNNSNLNTSNLELPAQVRSLAGSAGTIIPLSTIRNAVGTRPSTATGPESYNIDIFYTRRQPWDGSFYMEFANSTACSAISLLRSGSASTSTLLQAATTFNYGSTDTIFPIAKRTWTPASFYLSNAQITTNGLSLIKSTQTSTSSAAWYTDSRLKILAGFEATFSFTMSGNANGFAFILQDHSSTAKGSDGPGLGYSGLTKTIAFEFDSFVDPSTDSGLSGHHISVHRPDATFTTVSTESPTSWPIGSAPAVNIPGLPFNFSNSTKMNVRIELSPNEHTYWAYLYIGAEGFPLNVRPVMTAQFPKADMLNWFVDGAAYVGFTTSNTGSRAGNVDISNFKMTVIPPIAALSGPVPGSSLTAEAGAPLDIRVRLFDACGIPLPVRGEGGRFFGRFVHQNSEVPSTGLNIENDVYDIIDNLQVTDIVSDPGVYQFSSRGYTKRAGKWSAFLYFTEDDQIPISTPINLRGQPLGKTKRDINEVPFLPNIDNFHVATITSASPSPLHTRFIYSEITPDPNNVRNGAFFDGAATVGVNDVACVATFNDIRLRYDLNGILQKGKILTTVVQYNSFVAGLKATNLFAFCVSLSSQSATASSIPFQAQSAVVSPLPAPAFWKPLDTANLAKSSAVWAVNSDGKTYAFISDARTWVSAFIPIESGMTGAIGVYLSSFAPSRSSSGVGVGYILLQPSSIQADTVSSARFYIRARDAYQNDCTTQTTTTFTYFFTPTLSQIDPPTPSNLPFYDVNFTTQNSGLFQLTTSLESSTVPRIQFGNNGLLTVSAGQAHFTTSQQSGISAPGVVDVERSFEVELFDLLGNQVTIQNTNRIDIASIQWVNVEDASDIPFSLTQSDMFPFWVDLEQKYRIKYTPKFAGTFFVKIIINPVAGQPAANYEMYSSKGVSVTITAGPIHQYSIVNEVIGTNPEATKNAAGYYFPSNQYTAGQQVTYSIQARDKYGNRVLADTLGAGSFRLELFDNNSVVSPVVITPFTQAIDTTISKTYLPNSNYLKFTHVGGGVYRVFVFYRTASTIFPRVRFYNSDTDQNPTDVSAYVTGTVATQTRRQQTSESNGAFKALQVPVRWTATIIPGLITGKTTITLQCFVGTSWVNVGSTNCDIATSQSNPLNMPSPQLQSTVLRFVINPRDVYSNPVAFSNTNDLKAQLLFEYSTSVNDPSYYLSTSYFFDAITGSPTSFRGYLVIGVAGTYSLKVQVISDSTFITKADAKNDAFLVIPADSSVPTIGSLMTWPSAVSKTEPSFVRFRDYDLQQNGRSLFYAGAEKVLAIPFALYQSDVDASTNCESLIVCTVDNVRPDYVCEIPKYEGNALRRYLRLAPAACLPKPNGCPPDSCVTAKLVNAISDGSTNGFVRAISIAPSVGGTHGTPSLSTAPTTLTQDYLLPLQPQAGQEARIYIIENTIFDPQDNRALTLFPTPNSGSRVSTSEAIAQSCSLATYATICAGFANQRLYVFTLTSQQVIDSTIGGFQIRSIKVSTAHGTNQAFSYRIQVNSAVFSAPQSIRTTLFASSIEVGTSFQFGFEVYDRFRNPIIAADANSGISAVVDNAFAVAKIYADNVVIADRTGAIGQIVTCTFTAGSRVASGAGAQTSVTYTAGTVLCKIPEKYNNVVLFSVAKVYSFYFTAGTTTAVIANTPANAVQQVNNIVNFHNAKYSLVNSRLSLVSTQDGFFENVLAPIANKPSQVFLSLYDQYGNPDILTFATQFTNNQAIADIFSADVTVGKETLSTTSPFIAAGPVFTPVLSTTRRFVVQIDIVFTQVSFYGFQIQVKDTVASTPGPIATPSYQPFVKVVSADSDSATVHKATSSTAYETSETTSTTSSRIPLTIDSEFRFLAKVVDASLQPFLHNLATLGDAALVSSVFKFEGRAAIADQPAIGPRVLPTAISNFSLASVMQYGQFVFSSPSTSLALVGNYSLELFVTNGGIARSVGISYFAVGPGRPFMDLMQIDFPPQFANNGESIIKFRLYDRLNNLITSSYLPSTVPSTNSPGFGSTAAEIDKIQVTILKSAVSCSHDHADDSSLLGYRLDILNEDSNPNFELRNLVVDNLGEYGLTIKPQPAGIYTFNVTHVQTLTTQTIPRPAPYSGGYMSCDRMVSTQFNVKTGSPDPTTSNYKIISGLIGENNSLYAGETYVLELNLLDIDGSNTDHTFGQNLFWTPDETLSVSNELVFDPTNPSTSNLVSVVGTDLTELFGRGLARFEFIPKVANTFIFGAFIRTVNASGLFERISNVDSIKSVIVKHGQPKTVVFTSSPWTAVNANLIAGVPVTFTVIAKDQYENTVTTDELHNISISIVRRESTMAVPLVPIDSLLYTLPADQVTTSSTGVTTVKFIPVWEGRYNIIIRLTAKSGVFLTEAQSDLLTINHAACAAVYLATNPDAPTAEIPQYRCQSTQKCVLSYDLCTAAQDKIICPLGQYLSGSTCVAYGNGYIKCPDNSYVANASNCPPVVNCPAGTTSCEANPSQCRAQGATPVEGEPATPNANCPSQPACAPGSFICPNKITCATTLAGCPVIPQSAYDSCNGVVCANGKCVESAADCPTSKTCPGTQVFCLTDGSCRDSAMLCPTIAPGQTETTLTCRSSLGNDAVLCANRQCAASVDQCPSAMTCPVGYVLCAYDNTCKKLASQCYAPSSTIPIDPIKPDPTKLGCAAAEFTCPDGICAQNVQLCSSAVVCPSTSPILCADRSCKSHLALCTTPPTANCDEGYLQCPSTGQCVFASLDRCFHNAICKPGTVLCSNNSCAASISKCEAPPQCPERFPYMCPTGVCRSSLADCPNPFSCPAFNVLCADGSSCAFTVESCPVFVPPSTGGQYTEAGCVKGMTRCSNGACSSNPLTCPSIVTCPPSAQRCTDGTCRTACDGVNILVANCPSVGLITCPQSGAGVSCAKSLADCPQGQTCPISAPVKCIDATCAISINDCPPIPTDVYPTDRFPCSDGSFTTTTCSTPVTCPPASPIKCFDQTCRSTLGQCPTPQRCSSDDTPYLCTTGLCAAALWSCNSPDPLVCSPAAPVKCPGKDGSSVCVKTVLDCPVVAIADPNNLIPQTSDEIYTSKCQPGFTNCRDGSCAETPALCNFYNACPSSFPFVCPSGNCATRQSNCPLPNGCSSDRPQKCFGDGRCVAKLSSCPADKCAPNNRISCPDGTCADSTSGCVNAASGCLTNQTLCADGSCVSEAALCTSQANANYVNSCPPGSPFKCGNGFCATSSSYCVDLIPTGKCTDPTRPVLCASGECFQSNSLCPIVKPCAPGTTRCGNGSCRSGTPSSNACPNYDSCTNFGEKRCKQSDYTVPILDGLCSTNGTCLGLNSCPLSASQQPTYRCTDNGRCVTNQALCNSSIRLANGCTSDQPSKCWNGSCAKVGQCEFTNGCPFGNPVRCGDGSCLPSGSTCPVDNQTCAEGTVKCANGACKSSVDQCQTPFSCPVTAPVRCQNGTCKKYPATHRNPKFGLSNEEINALTCQPVSVCGYGYAMCENGQCVLNTSQCTTTEYSCLTNEYRCFDGQCRPSLDRCGFDLKSDENGNPVDETGAPITNPVDFIWEPSSSTPAQCPTASPMICRNGACVSDILSCDSSTDPTTTTIVGSPSSSVQDPNKPFQVLCVDGKWSDTYSSCRAAATQLEEALLAADPDYVSPCVDFCPDGTCVRANQLLSRVCSVLPRCPPNSYRCLDGSCRSSCDEVVTPDPCSGGTKLRVDGQCHSDFISFDGCSSEAQYHYHCPSRECASGPEDCANKANPNVDERAKELLKQSQYNLGPSSSMFVASGVQYIPLRSSSLIHNIPNSLVAEFAQQTVAYNKFVPLQTPGATIDPRDTRSCRTNCVASQKVSSTYILYSPFLTSQTYAVGPLSSGATIQMFSGLEVDNTPGLDQHIYLEPVSESSFFNASNRVTYSRVEDFGETMTSSQTILSPVFSCSVGNGIAEPFAIGMEYSSLIDRSKSPSPQPNDICLARLRRYPRFNYAVWECLYNETQRMSGDLRFSTRQSTTQPLRQAIGTIPRCSEGDDTDPAPAQFDIDGFSITQDDVSASTPAVYAFIHSPVATRQVYTQSEDNWFRNNIIWLLFVIIGGVCLIFFLAYAILRLSRYSKKTDKIKDEIDIAEKEIEEMEQYGEKRRDNEIGYVANPLAISLEQQKALAEQTDEEKIARKRQIMEAQQADSVERQNVIGSLEGDVDAQLASLEALRKKAGAKGGAKPT